MISDEFRKKVLEEMFYLAENMRKSLYGQISIADEDICPHAVELESGDKQIIRNICDVALEEYANIEREVEKIAENMEKIVKTPREQTIESKIRLVAGRILILYYYPLYGEYDMQQLVEAKEIER